VAGTLPRLNYYSLIMKPTFPACLCQDGSAPNIITIEVALEQTSFHMREFERLLDQLPIPPRISTAMQARAETLCNSGSPASRAHPSDTQNQKQGK
jgi:hypothetical protein